MRRVHQQGMIIQISDLSNGMPGEQVRCTRRHVRLAEESNRLGLRPGLIAQHDGQVDIFQRTHGRAICFHLQVDFRVSGM